MTARLSLTKTAGSWLTVPRGWLLTDQWHRPSTTLVGGGVVTEDRACRRRPHARLRHAGTREHQAFVEAHTRGAEGEGGETELEWDLVAWISQWTQ